MQEQDLDASGVAIVHLGKEEVKYDAIMMSRGVDRFRH